MSESDSDCEFEKKSSFDRADSKLHSSINQFGMNSYYYAHSRSAEYRIPENAIVTEGPGIVTGGQPQQISVGDPTRPSVVKVSFERL